MRVTVGDLPRAASTPKLRFRPARMVCTVEGGIRNNRDLPAVRSGVSPLSCRTGQVGRLAQFKRPVRIVCALLAAAAVVWSVVFADGVAGSALTTIGCAALVMVALLPVMTDFEIDVLGIRAKASLSTRQRELQVACEQVATRVSSLLQLVGVEREQIAAVVQEAVQDTCRLWRGRVAPDVVAQLVVCRAARLVQLSLQLGGPYRVRAPDHDPPVEPAWIAFARLDPLQRLIVGLISWLELTEDQVATMLDIDSGAVAAAMDRWNTG